MHQKFEANECSPRQELCCLSLVASGPIVLCAALAVAVGVKRYRQTLD
jgi:hypothetical protein